LEMDEMMRLFCVDIVVALTFSRPKLCQSTPCTTMRGLFRFVYFWCTASKGACKIEDILQLLRCVLYVSSEILSLE